MQICLPCDRAEKGSLVFLIVCTGISVLLAYLLNTNARCEGSAGSTSGFHSITKDRSLISPKLEGGMYPCLFPMTLLCSWRSTYLASL